LKVQIAQRHCHVPKDVLDRTGEQLDKLTRYEPHVGNAEVIYSEEKKTKNVEVILHISGSAPIVAHAEEAGFRSALDRALERVTRMLKKHRSRRTDHKATKFSETTAE
jgi:ribosomal subunit interface protein